MFTYGYVSVLMFGSAGFSLVALYAAVLELSAVFVSMSPSLFCFFQLFTADDMLSAPVAPFMYVPAICDIWSAAESASVLNLLSPRKDTEMSNSIMRPIDWSAVPWNPAYAPMSKMGLKSTPTCCVKLAPGFLDGSFEFRAAQAA